MRRPQEDGRRRFHPAHRGHSGRGDEQRLPSARDPGGCRRSACRPRLSAVIVKHELDYWTGTVYTTNRRVWEHDEKFKDYLRTIRAAAIDMETATIFVVGFVNHIPKGGCRSSPTTMTPEGVKTSLSDTEVTEHFVRKHLEVGIDTLIERDSGVSVKHMQLRGAARM